ncbi:MAG: T9SS type A sorting domain-containing protein [Ignavibacteria bacterium]
MRKIILPVLIVLTISTVHSQWTQISSASNNPFTHILNINGTLYACTGGIGIQKSTDSLATWQFINSGLNNSQALSVYQMLSSGSILFAATVGGIYKSTDAGASWVKKSSGIVVGGGALYEFTVSIFQNNNTLFTGAYTGIYRSTNDGENWIVTNASGSAVMPEFFINHNGLLFAARETNNMPYAYESTDGGLTWSDLNSNNEPTITFLSEENILWSGTIGGVWFTTNNGISWTSRNSGLSLDPYSSSIIRVNGTLITSLKFGGSGIYKSSNDGSNWINISDGLPFLESIDFLLVYGNKILAATSDGIWKRNISDIVTSVNKESGSLPHSYSLNQNYPNPFNPSTTINFSIPEKGYTELTLYDISGKKVKTMFNRIADAGEYSIALDGSALASGIYFYKLSSQAQNGSGGIFTNTRKMILLK